MYCLFLCAFPLENFLHQLWKKKSWEAFCSHLPYSLKTHCASNGPWDWGRDSWPVHWKWSWRRVRTYLHSVDPATSPGCGQPPQVLATASHLWAWTTSAGVTQVSLTGTWMSLYLINGHFTGSFYEMQRPLPRTEGPELLTTSLPSSSPPQYHIDILSVLIYRSPPGERKERKRFGKFWKIGVGRRGSQC